MFNQTEIPLINYLKYKFAIFPYNHKDFVKNKSNFESKYNEDWIFMNSLKPYKDKFNYMYKKHSHLLDLNFLSEISIDDKDNPNKFIQRYWELYIIDFFSNRGINIQKEKKAGPDLISDKFYLECVSPNIPKIADNISNLEEIEPPIILSITSSIYSKACINTTDSQYKKWIKNSVIEETKPYILAINTYDSNSLMHQNTSYIPFIIKPLFGLGLEQVMWVRDLNRIQKDTTFQTRNSVKKNESTKCINIDTNIFFQDNYKNISAILWSSINPINLDHSGNGLCLIHNPYTNNPLDMNDFKEIEQWKLSDDQLSKVKL